MNVRCEIRVIAVVVGWVALAGVLQGGEVSLRESDEAFEMQNGVVSARVEKRTGNLVSLRFQGLEMLAVGARGSDGGYWSSVGRSRPGGQRSTAVITDPAGNGGERAEVSVRFRNAPGAEPSPVDIEYRYTLGRGDQGMYVWSILEHKPGYPPFGVGEARYCVKLNPAVFDWMAIDEARNDLMPSGEDWDRGRPLNVKEARRMITGARQGKAEHKYSYSAVLAETPAYGWSSTKKNVGLWLINPSMEYIAGGPTKAELTAHLDVNPGGLPTLLNMWIGSHYGGTVLSIGTNDSWTKVVGPFLLYCNGGSAAAGEVGAAQTSLWREASRHAEQESRQWPYAWARHGGYPPAGERASVTGKLELKDAFAPGVNLSNLWVGLTAPDYLPPARGSGGAGRRPGSTGRNGESSPSDDSLNRLKPGQQTNVLGGPGVGTFAFRNGFPAEVDWQRDGRNYQYWARGDAQGHFKIPHVRPGTYCLRAFAGNVLGEFTLTNVVVACSGSNDLGALSWVPRRFGKTLWEIGVPDRTAREFRHGEDYWHWGTFFLYPHEFPRDVNFVIGKSDPARDWNYVQPPRLNQPVDREQPDFPEQLLSRSNVRSTLWTITFDLPKSGKGKAVLRLAFCGSHAGCRVAVEVNGKAIGDTGTLPSTSAMQREGVRAYWIEKNLAFDAALLKAGANRIGLRSEADSWSQGVNYDYLRLELE